MHLRDFDFTLPAELIAQTPAAKRDGSRLMIVDQQQRSIRHDGFANVGDYLCAGDVLVVNDTQVIPARLRGRKVGTGGSVEALLLHEVGGGAWEVLLKPAAKVPAGTEVAFGDGALRGRVGERTDHGAVILHFTPPDVLPALAEFGEVPLPPYIKRQQPAENREFDLERYQTVYACHPGAVAAPTAGLHFTPELLADLEQQGVQRATLTLHVGWGTFQPVRNDAVEQHRMGAERYQLAASEAERIERARESGHRVVAVGTTTTRTLETIGQETGRNTRRQRLVGTLYQARASFSRHRRPDHQFSPAALNALHARLRIRRPQSHARSLPDSRCRPVPLLQLRRRHAHPVSLSPDSRNDSGQPFFRSTSSLSSPPSGSCQ